MMDLNGMTPTVGGKTRKTDAREGESQERTRVSSPENIFQQWQTPKNNSRVIIFPRCEFIGDEFRKTIHCQ